MSERNAQRGAFIALSGWADASVESFPGDASSRRYFRLKRGDEVAVLMDAPTQCLAEIYRSSFPAKMFFKDANWRVRDYDETALQGRLD